MGRLKSHKSESLGFAEVIVFECKLLVEMIEVGEFLIILVVAMEVGNDLPIVEGDSFGMEILIGPLAAGLNGVEEPGGSGRDRE